MNKLLAAQLRSLVCRAFDAAVAASTPPSSAELARRVSIRSGAAKTVLKAAIADSVSDYRDNSASLDRRAAILIADGSLLDLPILRRRIEEHLSMISPDPAFTAPLVAAVAAIDAALAPAT